MAKIQKKKNQRKDKQFHRIGVSAEVYGRNNKKEDFEPIVINKDKDQIDRIYSKINQNLLFKNLNQEDKKIIVDAMSEHKFNLGENVITQGDSGDCFYIVDEGELDCFKVFELGSNPIYLKTYFKGEGFGELALLYNAPRAATIKARSNSILFKLDRGTFNHVITENTIKKRKRYSELIKSIELLDSLDPYEQQLLIDAFQEIKVEKGDYVIRQGDEGNVFYFVENGEAVALKKDNNTAIENEVFRYSRGAYFGEIALLNKVKRQASVKAVTDMTLMAIDKKSFERILGPLDIILQRNMDRYRQYISDERN